MYSNCIKNKNSVKENDLLVFHAFLELTEPSIFMAINKALDKNCTNKKYFHTFGSRQACTGRYTKWTKNLKTISDMKILQLYRIGKCNGIENMIISKCRLSIYQKIECFHP